MGHKEQRESLRYEQGENLRDKKVKGIELDYCHDYMESNEVIITPSFSGNYPRAKN